MVSKIDNITNIPDVFDDRFVVKMSEAEAQAFIQREFLTNSNFENRSPNRDIKQFVGFVKDVIESRQFTEGVKEKDRILFVEEDPPETIDTEAITYIVSKRVPGQFNQGAAGESRIKEIRPHIRSIVDHPNHPGEKLLTYGKFYDNYITFYIYAKTNKCALDRMLWFEKIMDAFNWYYKLNGFTVVEQGVSERERVNLDTTIVSRYPILYFVRTCYTYTQSTQEIKKLVLDVQI